MAAPTKTTVRDYGGSGVVTSFPATGLTHDIWNNAIAQAIQSYTDSRANWLTGFVNADQYNSIEAACAAIGSVNLTTLVISTTMSAATTAVPVTVTSNISVFPVAPGVINKGLATSLTINGPVVGNPMHQWLSGFAAGEVTFGSGSIVCLLPQWFGVKGDRVTDDYAAFELAYQCAAISTRALYVPSLAPGYYYKLTNSLTITHDSFTLYGEGVTSLLCAYNNTGLNAITVRGVHCHIRDIGITGILNSGCGIQSGIVGDPAHHGRYSNIWIGWMGSDCIRVVEGISNVWENINMSHDMGYRPATLIGATEGQRGHGINIYLHSSGINNDQRFIGCSVDAAAGTGKYQFNAGTDGSGSLELIQWNGGLIQGGIDNLIKMDNVDNAMFIGGDIEPSVGATGYQVILTSCDFVSFSDHMIQGDISLINCNDISIEKSRIYGASIGSGCTNTSIDNCKYANAVDGPTAGRIIDASGTANLTNLTNGSNTLSHTGNKMRKGIGELYFEERMEYWNGGASPTAPTHLTPVGGMIYSKEATIKKTGTYSCKQIITDKVTQWLQVSIDVTGINEVMVEAWVYNAAVTGNAMVTAVGSPSGADNPAISHQVNTWERIYATFTPVSTDTSISLHFGAAASAGTIYWDRIRIYITSINKIIEKILSTSTTPDLHSFGIPIKTFITGDTTSITNFTYPLVGEPFTIRFAHAKTIVYNASIIQLAGSVNFVGAVGNTLTLIYGDDGIFREISRMVS